MSWSGEKIFVNKYLDGTPLYSKGQADRVLERIRSEIDQGLFDPQVWGKDKILLFKNAWVLYCEQSQVGHVRDYQRELVYRKYLESFWKDLSLKEIEEVHIAKWWQGMPKDLAPSYLRQISVTLRAFFNHFSLTRRKAFRFPAITVPKKAVPWLTKDEQEKVLEFIPGQYEPVVRFIMAYGCRPSEVCNLKKADIDRTKGTITFRDRKNAEDNTLPILPEVYEILSEPHKMENLTYVFCTCYGGKISPKALSWIWNRANGLASQKYGLKRLPLKNGTRHSLASQLRNRGVSLGDIARILGNTEAIVEKSYGRVSVGRVAEVLRMEGK